MWISCTVAYLSDYQHTGHNLLCISTEREVYKWWWCKKEHCEPSVSARRWEGNVELHYEIVQSPAAVAKI